MQRTSVRRDEELRAPKKRHQLRQIEQFNEWLGRTGFAAYSFSKFALAGAETDYTLPIVALHQYAMQRAIAFRGPAFRTPATTRRKNEKVLYGARAEHAVDLLICLPADL